MSSRQSEYYRRNRQRELERSRVRVWAVKLETFRHYSYNSRSPACNRCGFNDLRALELDHISGNGAEERRSRGEPKRGGYGFYLWLAKRGYPPRYQVLCANCNRTKQYENGEYGMLGRYDCKGAPG